MAEQNEGRIYDFEEFKRRLSSSVTHHLTIDTLGPHKREVREEWRSDDVRVELSIGCTEVLGEFLTSARVLVFYQNDVVLVGAGNSIYQAFSDAIGKAKEKASSGSMTVGLRVCAPYIDIFDDEEGDSDGDASES